MTSQAFMWRRGARPTRSSTLRRDDMLRLCSRALVKVGTPAPRQLVRPGSAGVLSSRALSQQEAAPPSLPVPPLQQTCRLYLELVEPVVETQQLGRTIQLLQDFQEPGGVGERLQGGLQERAHSSENWLTDDYVRSEYLENRRSVVILSNVGMLFKPEAFKEKNLGQIRRAARSAAAVMGLKAMTDSDTLPAERMAGRPLCMKQFRQALSSCRVPGPQVDSVSFYGEKPRHVTVVHNCQFFKLDVYHADGSPLTVDQLCVQLEKICRSSQENQVEPLGILTSQPRDSWYRSYASLMQDETNKESVTTIQSSIAMLCLDGPNAPESHDQERAKILQVLHGGGSRWNSANRWFDKALQLIITDDGVFAGHMSHAVCDGTIMTTIADVLVDHMNQLEATASSVEALPEPQRLHFNITPELKKDIEEAKEYLNRLIQGLEQKVVIFNHFGKSVLKLHQVSPDGFVQMALQLAYYRLHRRISPTMEPISLRMFRRGRLALVNSNSSASARFIKAFEDPSKQDSEKLLLLQEALKSHRQSTVRALNGQAVRGHLFGLKMQALRDDVPMPDVFTDSSYAKAFDYQMATSQVVANCDSLVVMGPESPGVYDVYYGILGDRIQLAVSHFEFEEGGGEKNVGRLIAAVEAALLDMKTLLDQTARPGPGAPQQQ